LSVSVGFFGWLWVANSSTLGVAMPVLAGVSSAEAAPVGSNNSARAMGKAARIPTEVRTRMLVPESPYDGHPYDGQKRAWRVPRKRPEDSQNWINRSTLMRRSGPADLPFARSA